MFTPSFFFPSFFLFNSFLETACLEMSSFYTYAYLIIWLGKESSLEIIFIIKVLRALLTLFSIS